MLRKIGLALSTRDLRRRLSCSEDSLVTSYFDSAQFVSLLFETRISARLEHHTASLDVSCCSSLLFICTSYWLFSGTILFKTFSHNVTLLSWFVLLTMINLKGARKCVALAVNCPMDRCITTGTVCDRWCGLLRALYEAGN